MFFDRNRRLSAAFARKPLQLDFMLATVVGDEHRSFTDHHIPLDDPRHILGQHFQHVLRDGGNIDVFRFLIAGMTLPSQTRKLP